MDTPQVTPPAATQVSSSYESVTIQPKRSNSKYVIIALAVLLLLAAVAIVALLTQNKTQTPTPNPSNDIEESDIPVDTSEQDIDEDTDNEDEEPTEDTYTYGTFSFTYPTTWEVEEYFAEDNTGGKPFPQVTLTKGSELLRIYMSETKPNTMNGGIFMTDEEEQSFKTNNDEVVIEGETYYLNRASVDLNVFQSPDNHSGLSELGSLVEIPGTESYGYRDYSYLLKNKNGVDYTFVKFNTGTTVTNPTTQAELITILESINW